MSQAFDSIKNDEETYLLKTYARYPLAIDHGKGSRLWDCDSKEYIDLLAGIAVCGLGHCNDEVIGALTEQAQSSGTSATSSIRNLRFSLPSCWFPPHILPRPFSATPEPRLTRRPSSSPAAIPER